MTSLNLNLSGQADKPPTDRELRLEAAFFAAALLLALMLIGRFAWHLPLLPEILSDWLFAVTPISLVEIAVTLLGEFAKHLGFIGCAVIYLLLMTISGAAFLRRAAPPKLTTALAYSGALWLLTVALIIPILGGGFFGGKLWHGALISSVSLLIMHLVYGVALVKLWAAVTTTAALAETGRRLLDRRKAMGMVFTAMLVAAAYDIFKPLVESFFSGNKGKIANGNGVFPNLTGLALEITPTEDFYRVSKNPFDPEVSLRGWRLEIDGEVEQPLSFDYESLRKLPSVDQYATLMCISNEVGGDLIGNASWRGVRLRDLLQQARLKPNVFDIVLYAADDYTDSIPVQRAVADATILVYEMNGAPLTPAHGYPLRLLVPGIYGMKNVKWLKRIRAVNFDYKGYWQSRGWDDKAEYKTMSRIDLPHSGAKQTNNIIAGVAFGGDRGVSKVEISTDGGKTWEPAEIKPPLSPFTWVLWEKAWIPTAPGGYTIIVRATDGLGAIQTERYAPPIPSGSSGYHRLTVRID